MIKQFLKRLFLISLELAVIAGALWFIAEKKGLHTNQIVPALEKAANFQQERAFPQEGNIQAKAFSWVYKGVKYSLDENLSQNIYDYYKTMPKEYSYSGELPANWEDSYYGMFLKSNSADNTVIDLAGQLQSLGKKKNLSEDQIVELTMAFVQAIPYDDAKAQNILAKTGKETMQYPYETLFRQAGVCSDKSFLAYALLKQMGYGVALFAYEQDNHMSLGIQCAKDYSTYGSGYCYAETTSVGNVIGIIPNIDPSSNKTIATGELANFDLAKIQQNNLRQLGQVTIFDAVEGKQYSGIISTAKVQKDILSLGNQLTSLAKNLKSEKSDVSQEEKDLQSMQGDLKAYEKSGNIGEYNALVPKYNQLLESYKKDINKYNDDINLYNATVARYNVLIKQI